MLRNKTLNLLNSLIDDKTKFGNLTIIKISPINNKHTKCICQCDCGNITEVYVHNIIRGFTKSCGCIRDKLSIQRNKEKTEPLFDIGTKFERLTILKFSHFNKRHRRVYECQCDCGNITYIIHGQLKYKITQSCGCLKRDKLLLPNNKAQINSIIDSYKTHAKKINLSWELSFDDVDSVIRKNCFYCDTSPSNKITTNRRNKNKKYTFLYNGIDRINSNIGYLKNNIVSCCKPCNLAKRKMSKEEFLLWIKKVYEHLFKKL